MSSVASGLYRNVSIVTFQDNLAVRGKFPVKVLQWVADINDNKNGTIGSSPGTNQLVIFYCRGWKIEVPTKISLSNFLH